MKNTPIERHLIDETINEFQIVDFSKATIREVKAIASKAEAASGVEFIKMEMGVPGLPPSAVGVKAEIEALQNGIASLYPDINGLPELKKEASNFIKAFINVDFPTLGFPTIFTKPDLCISKLVFLLKKTFYKLSNSNFLQRYNNYSSLKIKVE